MVFKRVYSLVDSASSGCSSGGVFAVVCGLPVDSLATRFWHCRCLNMAGMIVPASDTTATATTIPIRPPVVMVSVFALTSLVDSAVPVDTVVTSPLTEVYDEAELSVAAVTLLLRLVSSDCIRVVP